MEIIPSRICPDDPREDPREDFDTLRTRIEELERVREEQKRAGEIRDILLDLGQKLNAATSYREAAEVIVSTADRIWGWDASLLVLYSEKDRAIMPVYSMNMKGGKRVETPEASIPVDPSPFTDEALSGGARLVQKDDLAKVKTLPFGTAISPSASLMYVPIRSGDHTVGLLTIQSHSADTYTDADLPILQSLAEHCAGALERIQSAEEQRHSDEKLRESLVRLQGTIAGTIEAISKIVEVRDPYTSGHQQRVAALAERIAREMGLSEKITRSIHMCSVIHDIGKIYVPTEILSCPRPLTDIEMLILKTHPQVGYDILKMIDFDWPLAEAVLQHHERMDGTGYPRGLRGPEIMIEARIIGVADVVEAMAYHRPYRPALSIGSALNEIESNSGIRFDGDAADICLWLFREKGYAFP